MSGTIDSIVAGRNAKSPITGIAFGTTLGVSSAVDYNTYREIVLIFDDGSNTQVLGSANSEWSRYSPTYRLQGPRIQRLIQLFRNPRVTRASLNCH